MRIYFGRHVALIGTSGPTHIPYVHMDHQGLFPLPIVSIVVPFFGLPFRILNIDLGEPKKGTTIETKGSSCFDLQEYSSGLVFQAS